MTESTPVVASYATNHLLAECRAAETAGFTAAQAPPDFLDPAPPPPDSPAAVRAAFGLGAAAAMIDELRDMVAVDRDEGFAFRVAETTFDYMAARELVASAAAVDGSPDATLAILQVGELLRRCLNEYLALGSHPSDPDRLPLLMGGDGGILSLCRLDVQHLEQAAEDVLGRPGGLLRIEEATP